MAEDLVGRILQLQQQTLHGLYRQGEIKDLADDVPKFSGDSALSYNRFIKHMERIHREHPDDAPLLKRLISKSVCAGAEDYWDEYVTEHTPRPDADANAIAAGELAFQWAAIKRAFETRYRNYVNTDTALAGLQRIIQGKGEDIHSYYHRVNDLARHAFTDADRLTPFVNKTVKDSFINGLVDKNIARTLVKESPATLSDCLSRALDMKSLHDSYRTRGLNTYGMDTQGRRIVPMDVNMLNNEISEMTLTDTHATTVDTPPSQWDAVTESLAVIAAHIQGDRPNNTNRNTYQQQGGRQNNPNRNTQQQQYTYKKPVHDNTRNKQKRYQSHNVPNRNSRYGQNPSNQPQTSSFTDFFSSLRWTEQGKPICHFCSKEGHVRKECYALHPELRQKQKTQSKQPQSATTSN